MIKDTLSNLVSTIIEMQKNQEDKKKDKESPQAKESYWVVKKLPLKLEVKFELKSFGGEIDPKWLNQWFK